MGDIAGLFRDGRARSGFGRKSEWWSLYERGRRRNKKGRSETGPFWLKVYDLLEGEADGQAQGPRVLQQDRRVVTAVLDHAALGVCFCGQVIARKELLDVISEGLVGGVCKREPFVAATERIRTDSEDGMLVEGVCDIKLEAEPHRFIGLADLEGVAKVKVGLSVERHASIVLHAAQGPDTCRWILNEVSKSAALVKELASRGAV